jgi:outer membrane lipoprotein-sorting protein
MKYVKMNLFIIFVALTVILVPSFALISSSQTNETSPDDASSNQSSFSSMSREFAQNQSGSDDDSNQDNK